MAENLNGNSALQQRNERISERLAQLKSRTPKVEMVRVEPTKDDYRKYLRHPKGIAFPASGAAEWPRDRFTNRRIADGSVRLAEQKEHQPSPRPHQQRQHRGSDE